MISLKTTYRFFFILGVFFLPFNSEPPSFMSFLGEYSRESSPLFFLIGVVFLLINDLFRGKIYLPLNKQPYNLFLFFFAVILLSGLFNFWDISNYYFKQTPGWVRYLNQVMSVVLSPILFFYLFCNVIRDSGIVNSFLLIRRVFFCSLVIVTCYASLEFLIITYNINSLVPIINLFDYLPFVEVKLDYRLLRISSLTYEPPALGMYLITISGFMFSYILTNKKWYKFVPFLVVLILVLLSKSRSAFVIIFAQMFVAVMYAYMINSKFRLIFKRMIIVLAFIFVNILIFKNDAVVAAVKNRIKALDFSETTYKSDNYSISNKSRLGIQYANYLVFLENPILGVGWGQQSYESKNKYPDWAMKNNYEFSSKYLNEDLKSFPPGYNLYLRVLTETGLIGFVTFMIFILGVVFILISSLKKTKLENTYIPLAILIGLVGFLLNWLQIDTFRIYGFWLFLAFAIQIKKKEWQI